MTLLVVALQEESPTALLAQAEQARSAGAEAIELRLDSCSGDLEPIRQWLAAVRGQCPVILTLRPEDQGGQYAGSLQDRVAALLAVARGSGAWVDFEWSDWQRSANLRQKVLLAANDPASGATRLILSHHDFDRPIAEPGDLLAAMHAAHPQAMAKLAWTARNITDALPALDALHAASRPAVAIAMGEAGLITRVLAKKLGAWATYASLAGGQATAPGQVDVQQLLSEYRWAKLGPATRVFGVLGDPVAHSLSPLLFNAWFDRHDVDAVFLPLCVQGGEPALRAWLDGCVQRPWLDVGGFSVTVPHKESVFRWLGERVETQAGRIGAVNTLAWEPAGVRGYNTDAPGAWQALAAAWPGSPADWQGMPVDVLGAGGAARALVAALQDAGAAVTVYARRLEQAERLTAELGGTALPWQQRLHRAGKVVVNCTTIGMWPDVDATPLPAEALGGAELVFDAVYRPLTTKLLADAGTQGAVCVTGLEMFVHQAAAQYEHWLGATPDLALARQVLEAALATRGDE